MILEVCPVRFGVAVTLLASAVDQTDGQCAQ